MTPQVFICKKCGKRVSRATRVGKNKYCSVLCAIRFHNAHRHVPRGKESHMWGGGKTISGGYVRIMSRGHHEASSSGYAFEHRVVMEKKIGRDLLPSETVHHKNGIKTDNRISNLELWSSRQPEGQRVIDKIRWAIHTIRLYEPTLKFETRLVRYKFSFKAPEEDKSSGKIVRDKAGYVTVPIQKMVGGIKVNRRTQAHRIIFSEWLGRPLMKNEKIHHKNGVRDDNRISNLELWHTGQPKGQHVVDKVKWAKEILKLYAKEKKR